MFLSQSVFCNIEGPVILCINTEYNYSTTSNTSGNPIVEVTMGFNPDIQYTPKIVSYNKFTLEIDDSSVTGGEIWVKFQDDTVLKMQIGIVSEDLYVGYFINLDPFIYGDNINVSTCLGDITLGLIYEYNIGIFDIQYLEFAWTKDEVDVTDQITYDVTYNPSYFTFKNINLMINELGSFDLCLHPKLIGENCYYKPQCITIDAYDIEITPSFEALGIDLNDVCSSQIVTFQNTTDLSNLPLSDGIPQWSVLNSNNEEIFNTNQTDLIYQFNTSGSYSVVLDYILPDNCESISTTSMVDVNETPLVPITCPSVVCTGSEPVTYSIDPSYNCAGITWDVSPEGTYTITGPNSIEVEWNSTSSGQTGYVSVDVESCTPNLCSPSVVAVPIIGSEISITGNKFICGSQIEYYEAPYYPGSSYSWTITDDDENSVPFSATNNVIAVYGFPEGLSTISLEMYNPFAGCSVSTTCIVENPLLEYDSEICLGPLISITSSSSQQSITFNLVSPSGETFVGNSSPFTHDPTKSGIYEVVITYGDFTCSESLMINVLDFEAPSISGENIVCLGTTNSYNIICGSNESAEWTISFDDMVVHSGSQCEISYNFNMEGVYDISVFKEVILSNGQPCQSATQHMTVTTLLPSIGIEGPDELCFNTIEEYNLTTFPEGTPFWVITPSELGSVVNGQNTESVSIQWFSTDMPTQATITCTTEYCDEDVTAELTVNLNTASPLTFDAPNEICQFEDFTLAVLDETGAALSEYATIDWFVDGELLSGHLNENDFLFSFNEPGTFSISVQVSSPTTCNTFFVETTTITVKTTPATQLGLNSVCDDDLVLLSVTGDVANPISIDAEYTWAIDGVTISGETNSSITILASNLPLNATSITVTETLNDCTGTDTKDIAACNEVEGENCQVNITMSATLNNCEEIGYVGTSPDFNQADRIVLVYNGEELEVVTINDELDLVGSFDISGDPGNYFVYLYHDCELDGEVKEVFATSLVTIPFNPDFDYEFYCNEQNDLNIRIYDNSNFINGIYTFQGEVSWTVNTVTKVSSINGFVEFDNISYDSPINISQSVTHPDYADYSANCGTETYQIQSPMPNEIEILTLDQICTNAGIEMSVLESTNTGVIFNWDFNDGSTANGSTISKAYSSTGTKTINLEVESSDGCKSYTSKNVEVQMTELDGEFTHEMLGICNSQALLTFTPDSEIGIASYNWSDFPGNNANEVEIMISGSYNLEITDITGCVHYFTSPYIELNDAFSTMPSIIDQSCSVKKLSLDMSANYNYVIRTKLPNGDIVCDETTFDENGSYLVSIFVFETEAPECDQDMSGACMEYQLDFDVLPDPVAPEISDIEITLCDPVKREVSVINFDPTLYTVSWTSNSLAISETSETLTIFDSNISAAGDKITVMYTDIATKCTSEFDFFIYKITPDLSSMISGCYTTCEDGKLLLDGVLTAPLNANIGSWSWNLGSAELFSGTATTPPDLIIKDLELELGEYEITFVYVIEDCVFKSLPFCLTVEDCTQAPCLVYADGEACGFDPIDCAVSENDGGPIYFINMDYFIPSGEDFDPPIPGLTLTTLDCPQIIGMVDNGTLYVSEFQQIGSDQLSVIGSFSVDNTAIWGSNPLAIQVEYCGSDSNTYCVQYQINPVNCPIDPLECNVWYVGSASAGPKDRDNYLAQYCVNLYNVNSNGCQSTDWTIEGEFEDTYGIITPAYYETISIAGQGQVVTHCFDVNIPITMDFSQVPFINFNITSNCPGIGCFHQFWHLGTENYSGNPLPLIGVPNDETENVFTINLPQEDYPDLINGSLYFDGKVYDVTGSNPDWKVIINKPNLINQNLDLAGVIEYVNSKNESIVKVVKIDLDHNSNNRTKKHKIFPNPFSGELNIETAFTENTKIEVLDILGRRISFAQRDINSSQAALTIEAKPGLYFVNIYENDILIVSEKVIKL